MELEQAQKRVEELRAVIEKNNRLYYDQDAPELEDFEYDALTRELKELEAQFPQLVTPNSPTQHVGGTPSGRYAKVTHANKMESHFATLAAWNTKTVRWCGLPPAATVWAAKT